MHDCKKLLTHKEEIEEEGDNNENNEQQRRWQRSSVRTLNNERFLIHFLCCDHGQPDCICCDGKFPEEIVTHSDSILVVSFYLLVAFEMWLDWICYKIVKYSRPQ